MHCQQLGTQWLVHPRFTAYFHCAYLPCCVQVFLPLTRLCRDSCGYCTFAQPPQPGRRCYMALQEVLQVAQLGAAQGCTEALFTLGETHTALR